MKCRICNDNEVLSATPSFDLCSDCARTLGAVPLGPPTRPARPCDRCNGMRFVRARPRELTEYLPAAMAMTIEPQPWDKLFGGKHVPPLQAQHGRGWLEAYACLGCGFVEWYCLDPQSVPIGPEYMTDVVDYTTDQPYR